MKGKNVRNFLHLKELRHALYPTDLGGCYPPRPSASVDNTLLDLQNSSHPTQPHSIIANYFMESACVRDFHTNW